MGFFLLFASLPTLLRVLGGSRKYFRGILNMTGRLGERTVQATHSNELGRLGNMGTELRIEDRLDQAGIATGFPDVIATTRATREPGILDLNHAKHPGRPSQGKTGPRDHLIGGIGPLRWGQGLQRLRLRARHGETGRVEPTNVVLDYRIQVRRDEETVDPVMVAHIGDQPVQGGRIEGDLGNKVSINIATARSLGGQTEYK
jgi:hypothetical protein